MNAATRMVAPKHDAARAAIAATLDSFVDLGLVPCFLADDIKNDVIKAVEDAIKPELTPPKNVAPALATHISTWQQRMGGYPLDAPACNRTEVCMTEESKELRAECGRLANGWAEAFRVAVEWQREGERLQLELAMRNAKPTIVLTHGEMAVDLRKAIKRAQDQNTRLLAGNGEYSGKLAVPVETIEAIICQQTGPAPAHQKALPKYCLVPASVMTLGDCYRFGVDIAAVRGDLVQSTGNTVALSDEQVADPKFVRGFVAGAMDACNYAIGQANVLREAVRKQMYPEVSAQGVSTPGAAADEMLITDAVSDVMNHDIRPTSPTTLAIGQAVLSAERRRAAPQLVDADRFREVVRLIGYVETGKADEPAWSLDLPRPTRSGNTDEVFVAAIDKSRMSR